MRLAFLVFVLLTSTAFACPQLTGNYATCRSSSGDADGSRDLVITQSTGAGGYTHFSVTSTDEESQERSTETIIADGVKRTETQTDPQSGMTFVVTRMAQCVGNTLELQMTTTMEGQTIADLQSVVRKNSSELITKTSGQVMGESVNDTSVCQ